MDTPSLAITNGPPVRPRSRAWIWYFVLLAILTVAMITSLIVFNVGQQLTPEKLAAAIALWKERGPTSYDMEYTKPMVNETFKVRVRKGDVVSVTMNDQPLPEREYPYHSMRALFGFIERFQQIDQEPGQPRAF